GAQKSIHVSLGKFAWTSLSFDSGVQDRGRLVSDDIDSDGDADLVWVSQSYPRTFVAWLGDGRGNFSIDTRHDRAPAQAMLETRQQTRLTGDPDACDSTAVLQSTMAVSGPPSRLLFPAHYSHRDPQIP